MFHQIGLLQSPGVFADSDISLPSLFPLSFRSNCSLSASKMMPVVLPDTLAAMTQASSASAVSIPSWVAKVDGSLVVMSHHTPSIVCTFCSRHAWPSQIVQRCWKCRLGVNMMVKIECQCLLVARFRGHWVLSPILFLFLAQSFHKSTQMCGFICLCSTVTIPCILYSSRGTGSTSPGAIECYKSSAGICISISIVLAELFCHFCCRQDLLHKKEYFLKFSYSIQQNL